MEQSEISRVVLFFSLFRIMIIFSHVSEVEEQQVTHEQVRNIPLSCRFEQVGKFLVLLFFG